MTDIVIRAENLSKRYRIGERERYLALRDVLTRALSAPMRIFRPPTTASGNSNHSHIWALKDVTFEVRQGEVVGIIGRNGAGKTTLLKILSRVTNPTGGFAEVRGRMGSLLEVGTGFHPELTGRENVFLNGAILGMSKAEICRKFDEIVAFAEVERFIDTPVKHYSTGMQTRLAFAVAAHLEPEILLIDEVLSVGDLQFQKKCLGKMGDVAKAGRTILFVSHQMNQIRRLCNRVFWVHQSGIRACGPTGQVAAAYEASQLSPQESAGKCFIGWEIAGHGNCVRSNFEGLALRFHIMLKEPVVRGHFGVAIKDESGRTLIGWGFDELEVSAGSQDVNLKIPILPLRPGVYTILCSLFNRGNNLTDGSLVDLWEAQPPLVVDTMPLTHPQEEWAGILNIPADLEVAGVPIAASGGH